MGQGKTESYIIVCKKIDKNIIFFFWGLYPGEIGMTGLKDTSFHIVLSYLIQ